MALSKRQVVFIGLALLAIIIYAVYKNRGHSASMVGGPGRRHPIEEHNSPSRRGAMGTILRRQLTLSERGTLDRRTRKAIRRKTVELPESYDPREEHPDQMSDPLDQGQCGSCWAFATASALSDRIRKMSTEHLHFEIDYKNSDGTDRVVRNQLSPYLLAGCNYCGRKDEISDILQRKDQCNQQCDGGVIQYAYIYVNDNGLISIGCNNTQAQYLCHTLAGIEEKEAQGKNTKGGSAKCNRWMFGQAQRVSLYEPEVLDGSDPQKLIDNEQAIMQEIYQNGSVTVGYTVYNNFNDYFSSDPKAIYRDVGDGSQEGGHAVVIVGWGVSEGLEENCNVDSDCPQGQQCDNGTCAAIPDVGKPQGTPVKFWILRNSWSEKWGDGGYFRMLRGQNFCGIEEDVWGAVPTKVGD